MNPTTTTDNNNKRIKDNMKRLLHKDAGWQDDHWNDKGLAAAGVKVAGKNSKDGLKDGSRNEIAQI